MFSVQIIKGAKNTLKDNSNNLREIIQDLIDENATRESVRGEVKGIDLNELESILSELGIKKSSK